MKTPEILLVDDNPADTDLTSEVLAQSKQHYHVSTVSDGAEAISFLRQQGKYTTAPSPDLVVLDLNLPIRDGRQVLSDIKADPALQKIPVVIFTTSQANSGKNSTVGVPMRIARAVFNCRSKLSQAGPPRARPTSLTPSSSFRASSTEQACL